MTPGWGVGAYEERMREYAYPAVISSRKQMSGDDPIHRPVIGRVLAGMRTAMRAVDRTPPLKRRMATSMLRFRGADRDAEEFTLSL